VKFTRTGGIDVRLSACWRDEAQALRFEVTDTGVGISDEAQASLFQRFHQADGSTTRRFGGSGLGLAISQRLAELLGGIAATARGEGAYTLWVQQTGTDRTAYAIEIAIGLQ
jgi:signal transduction histidine kinase